MVVPSLIFLSERCYKPLLFCDTRKTVNPLFSCLRGNGKPATVKLNCPKPPATMISGISHLSQGSTMMITLVFGGRVPLELPVL
jgi:hypothetical protein